jgi:predicted MFS family arabinose efflux permease
MSSTEKSKAFKIAQLLALGVAGGSIYLIPFIKYVFYDFMIGAMNISNMQAGLLLTAYGIGCVILYIPGGIIADKFSPKKCMLVSLLATTALTIVFAFAMGNSFALSLFIWLLLAITTGFLFWAALIKTISLVGDEKEQGFMFGVYYCGNGLTGAIVNSIGLKATSLAGDVSGKFFIAVITYGIATFVAAILVFSLIPENKKEAVALKKDPKDDFNFSQVGQLLKSPGVWLLGIIIFCGYSIFSSISYFTPYLTEVKGITPEESGFLSIVRNYVFYVLTPLSGFIADRVIKSTSKWFMMLYLVLGALFFGVFLIPSGASAGFVSFYTLLPGMFGLALYGINFSIAAEIRIPTAVYATAIGIVTVIGYSPDLFMSAMFGSWLDAYGSSGYNLIFNFLGAMCVVAFICATIVRVRSKKPLAQ